MKLEGPVTAREVERYWKKRFKNWKDERKISILNKLKKLPDNASVEEIDEAIGNSSWTTMYCNGCQKEHLTVVEIDEYDGSCICYNCALEVVRIFENRKEPK